MSTYSYTVDSDNRLTIYGDATTGANTFTMPFSSTNLPPWANNSYQGIIMESNFRSESFMDYFFYGVTSEETLVWYDDRTDRTSANSKIEFDWYSTAYMFANSNIEDKAVVMKDSTYEDLHYRAFNCTVATGMYQNARVCCTTWSDTDGLKLPKVTQMDYMFNGAYGDDFLTDIFDCVGYYTTIVKAKCAFKDAKMVSSNGVLYGLSNAIIGSECDCTSMYEHVTLLNSSLNEWDTYVAEMKNITWGANATRMFANNPQLVAYASPNSNGNVSCHWITDGKEMFADCTKLQSVCGIGMYESSYVYRTDPLDFSGMFKNCTSLTTINNPSLTMGFNGDVETALPVKFDEMFYNCSSLTEIKSEPNTDWNIDFPSGSTGTNMFYGCTNLNAYNPSYVDLLEANNTASGHTVGYFNEVDLYYRIRTREEYDTSTTPAVLKYRHEIWFSTYDEGTYNSTTGTFESDWIGATHGIDYGVSITSPWASYVQDFYTNLHSDNGEYQNASRIVVYFNHSDSTQPNDWVWKFPPHCEGFFKDFANVEDASSHYRMNIKVEFYAGDNTSLNFDEVQYADSMFEDFTGIEYPIRIEWADSSKADTFLTYGGSLKTLTNMFKGLNTSQCEWYDASTYDWKKTNEALSDGPWGYIGTSLGQMFSFIKNFEEGNEYTLVTDFTGLYAKIPYWYKIVFGTNINAPSILDNTFEGIDDDVLNRLETIDLRTFRYDVLTSTNHTFENNPNLVYIRTPWDIAWDDTLPSTNMFTNSVELPNFNESFVTATEAHCLTDPTTSGTHYTAGYFSPDITQSFYYKKDEDNHTFWVSNTQYDGYVELSWKKSSTLDVTIDNPVATWTTPIGTPWDHTQGWDEGQEYEGQTDWKIKVDSRDTEFWLNGDVSNMFARAVGVNYIDTSLFKTTYSTSFESMFVSCINLTSVDVSNWAVARATSSESMFANCTKLNTITGITDWNIVQVSVADNMFANCSALTSLDISGWGDGSTNNCYFTSLKGMFVNCSALSSIKLFKETGDKLLSTQSMFTNCTSLTSIDVPFANESYNKWADGSSMFKNCTALKTITFSLVPPSTHFICMEMFYNCSSLEKISVPPQTDWNNNRGTDLPIFEIYQGEDMFYGCEKLPFFDSDYVTLTEANNVWGGYTPGYFNVVDYNFYYYVTTLESGEKEVIFSNSNWYGIMTKYTTQTSVSHPWIDCTVVYIMGIGSEYDGITNNVCFLPVNSSHMFSGMSIDRFIYSEDMNGTYCSVNTDFVTDTSHMFDSTECSSRETVIVPSLKRTKNASYMYYKSNCVPTSTYATSVPTQITNASRMFFDSDWYNTDWINKLELGEVLNASYMFYSSSSNPYSTTIDSLQLDSLGTMSKVENVESMFANLKLTIPATEEEKSTKGIIDVSNLPVNNVTNFKNMFNGTTATTIDIEGWELSSTEDVVMDGMFKSNSYLGDIDVGDSNVDWYATLGSRCTSSTDMFTDSTRLPSFSSSYLTITEANNTASGGTDGYFGGYKEGYFYKISGTNVFFSNKKYPGYTEVGTLTASSAPWSSCVSYDYQGGESIYPQSVDKTPFKFPPTSDYWFYNCSGIDFEAKDSTTFDWHWDTSEITSARGMFYGTTMDMGVTDDATTAPSTFLVKNDFTNVTDMSGFYSKVNNTNDINQVSLEDVVSLPACRNFSSFFNDIQNTTSIIIRWFTFGSSTDTINIDRMFSNISTLKEIPANDNTDWTVSYNISGDNVFTNSTNVPNYVSGFNTYLECNNTGSSGNTLGYFGNTPGYYYKIVDDTCYFSNTRFDSSWLDANSWDRTQPCPWSNVDHICAYKDGTVNSYEFPADCTGYFNNLKAGVTDISSIEGTTWVTSSINNMERMFESAKTVYICETFDVSSVVSMYQMFKNASTDTPANLLISSWNPVKCKNVNEMFYNFGNTTDLTTSAGNIEMPNNFPLLANMESVFEGARFTQVNWGNLKAPLLTSATKVFKGWKFTTDADTDNRIEVYNWNVPKLTTVDEFFAEPRYDLLTEGLLANNISLKFLNSGWNAPLTSLKGAFKGALINTGSVIDGESEDSKLTQTVGSYSFNSTINNWEHTDEMFMGCSQAYIGTTRVWNNIYGALDSLNGSTLVKLETASKMFCNGFDSTGKLIASRPHGGYTILTKTVATSLTALKDASYMFAGCEFDTFALNSTKIQSIESTESMFEGCSNLYDLSLPTWGDSSSDLSHWTNAKRMFYNDAKLKYIRVDGRQNWADTNSLATSGSDDAFYGCNALDNSYVNYDSSYITFTEANNVHANHTYGYLYYYRIYYKVVDGTCTFSETQLDSTWTEVPMNTSTPWKSCTTIAVDSATDKLIWPLTVRNSFNNCVFTTFDADKKFDFEYTENFSMAFMGCTGNIDLDLSYTNVKSVTDLSYAFEGTKFTSINLKGWDVSNCTTFSNCMADNTSLTNVNITDWHPKSATTLSKFFYGDTRLKEIMAGSGTNWRADAPSASSTNMFTNCTKIKEFSSLYVTDTEANNTGSGATKGYFSKPDGGYVYLNIGGTWKQAQVFLNVGGTWKEVTIFRNVGGTWKETV